MQPAASLARQAQSKGTVLVELNAEPTPLSDQVDFFFPGKAGEMIPALQRAAW